MNHRHLKSNHSNIEQYSYFPLSPNLFFPKSTIYYCPQPLSCTNQNLEAILDTFLSPPSQHKSHYQVLFILPPKYFLNPSQSTYIPLVQAIWTTAVN